MPNGYEEIYQNLLLRLKACDLEESSARLGLSYISGQKISVNFLNREYIITREGAEPADGLPVNINNRNILLYYVLSKGSEEPKFSFIPMSRLTGMIAGHNIPTDGIMIAPLLREFGNALEKLKIAASMFSGKYEKISNGSHSWIFTPLPKIPMKMIFHESDDEFPADIQIMFDEIAHKFMDFECLAFLCGCFVRALIESLNLCK